MYYAFLSCDIWEIWIALSTVSLPWPSLLFAYLSCVKNLVHDIFFLQFLNNSIKIIPGRKVRWRDTLCPNHRYEESIWNILFYACANILLSILKHPNCKKKKNGNWSTRATYAATYFASQKCHACSFNNSLKRCSRFRPYVVLLPRDNPRSLLADCVYNGEPRYNATSLLRDNMCLWFTVSRPTTSSAHLFSCYDDVTELFTLRM